MLYRFTENAGYMLVFQFMADGAINYLFTYLFIIKQQRAIRPLTGCISIQQSICR